MTIKQEIKIEKHVIIALVDNEFGVLARVVGLFSGRGYNIESLTVAGVTKDNSLSRITIVTSGSTKVIEQIKALLNRLIPVYEVRDLTAEGRAVERELALIKICTAGETRLEALRIADIFRAKVIDATPDSFIFEMTGKSEKIDAFLELMQPLGMCEHSRTGVTAMSRGKELLTLEECDDYIGD